MTDNAEDRFPKAPQFGAAPETALPEIALPRASFPRAGNDPAYGNFPAPYNQPAQYGQQAQYSRPAQYGQQAQYGQPVQYGQQAQYGQPVQYGQPTPYGAPAPYPAPVQYGAPAPSVAPMPYPAPYAGQVMSPYGQDPRTGLPFSYRSKAVAGLLQLFFGFVGAGRWYIGSTGIAAVQLLMFIFGCITAVFIVGGVLLLGLSVWVFVDAIMMFCGGVRDGEGRSLR